MAITIPHSFTSGTIAEASEMNANFTTVGSYVNGLSTGANIDAGAIAATNIAANAVTNSKIADGAISYIKLDSADVPNSLAVNDQIVLAGQVFG